MAKKFKVLVLADQAENTHALDVEQGAANPGRVLRIKAIAQAKYQLQEVGKAHGLAPDVIKVKRVGHHLHVMFDGSLEGDLIIEDYYDVMPKGYNGIIGQAENGFFYKYLTQDPNEEGLIGYLKDEIGVVAQALGGDEDSYFETAVAFFVPTFNPLLPVLGWVGVGSSALAGAGGDTLTAHPTKMGISKLGDMVVYAHAGTQSLLNGGLTNDKIPTLKGQASSGSVITIKDGNTVLGSTTADANGNWSFTATALNQGQHKFTANSTTNGTTSTSAVFEISVDSIAPNGGHPVGLTIDADVNHDGWINREELGGKTTLSLSSSFDGSQVEVGDTVIFFLSDGSTQAVTIDAAAKAAGKVTLANVPAPAEGQSIRIKAVIKDPAGNTSIEARANAQRDTSNLGSPDQASGQDGDKNSVRIHFISDVDNNGVLGVSELKGGKIHVKVTLPADAKVGDTLVVEGTGNAVQTITLSAEQVLAKQVLVTLNAPANGIHLVCTVALTDLAKNTSGKVTASVVINTTVAAAPTVEFLEDTDTNGYISKTELKDQIHVKVTAPLGAVVGDTITITITDGSGVPQILVLTQVHINHGIFTRTAAPVDGSVLSIAATHTATGGHKPSGNVSAPGVGIVKIDLTDFSQVNPQGARISAVGVKIDTDAVGEGDGIITQLELEKTGGHIQVSVSLPAGAAVGDSLMIKASGHSDRMIRLTQADIIAKKLVITDYNSVGDGHTFIVSASIHDAAGNTSPTPDASDSATVRTVIADAPVVTITNDGNHDGYINSAESRGTVSVNIRIPSAAKVGDRLIVTINGVSENIVLTALQIDAGRIAKEVPTPADGSQLTVKAQLIDPGNQASLEGSAMTTMDTTSPVGGITIDAITGDDFLTVSEQSGMVTISGRVTGEFLVGDIVSINFNGVDTPYSAAVNASGKYSVAGVRGAALSSYANVQARILAHDSALNSSTYSNTRTYTRDSSADAVKTALSLDMVAGDNVITINESGNVSTHLTGKVTGKFATGDLVTLTVHEKEFTGTVDASGMYNIAVSTADLVADVDTRVEARIAATVGRSPQTAVAAQDYVVTDLRTAGQLTALSIDPVTADNIIDAAEKSGVMAITGKVTGQFAVGDSVTLLVNGNPVTGSIKSDGSYSINVAADELVADGNTQIEGRVTGTGGTLAHAMQNYAVDLNRGPTHTLPNKQTAVEDLQKAILGISVTDIDGNLSSTQLNVQHGSIHVSLTGGAMISAGANDSASMTLRGRQDQINSALASIKYTGAHNYNGTDTLSIVSWDEDGAVSSTDTVGLHVTGVNDLATISGTATGEVTEDAEATSARGTLTVTDVDSGQAVFQTLESLAGQYGTYTFDAVTGSWTYALDNTKAAVQALPEGKQLTDRLTVKSIDGSATQDIVVTITGCNDTATISGTASGAATEDSQTPTARGTLTVTDVDSGQAVFQKPESLAGQYGTYTFDATTGSWTYALDNTKVAVQALPEGKQMTDTLTVKSSDGSATQDIVVTITGSNDTATISGTASGAATEDAQTPTASGMLRVSDVDSGQAVFQKPESLAGQYGTYTFDAVTGVWTYALDNTKVAVQALPEGKQMTDTLTVKSSDGSATQDIVVTINGVNDTATFSGDTSKGITQTDTAQTVTGSLTVIDMDSANSVVAQSNAAGSAGLGKFSITTEGAWTYVMINAQSQLKSGQVITDSLTITTADGTQKVISVVITGTNDAPVLTTSAVLTYIEGQAATAINTLVSLSDVDNSTQASATVAITSGYVPGEDALSFVGDSATMGNITGNYSAGVMSLVSAGGSATLTQWQTALQAVKYSNSSANPKTAARTVSYTLNDGALDSVVLTSTINVVSVNNAPVNTVPTSQTTAEDTAKVISGLSIADADAGTGIMTVTLSVAHGTITVAAGTGVALTTNDTASVTLSGTVADINTLLASVSAVTYTPKLNYNGSDTLKMLTSDNGNTGGTALTDSDSVAITVTAVNDQPGTVALSYTGLEDNGGVNLATAPVPTGAMGSLISSLANILSNSNDVDNTNLGVAITSGLSTSANGKLWYSTDSGSTWTDLSTLTGANALSETNALVLSSTARLYFQGSANTFGAVATANMRLWDGSDSASSGSFVDVTAASGTSGAYSAANSTLSLNLTAINDEPALSATGTSLCTNAASNLTLFGNASADLGNAAESTQKFSSMTLKVSGLANGADEQITLDGMDIPLVTGSITTPTMHGWTATVTLVSDTATITLTNSAGATVSELNTLVNGMRYSNASSSPTDGDRVITITRLRDNGGTANTGDDTVALNIASTITLDTTASTTLATIDAIHDDIGLIKGVVAHNGKTDDTALNISGTLNNVLVAGETLRIYDAATLLGTAVVTTTGATSTWTFADGRTLIDAQTVAYKAVVYDGLNEGVVSNTYSASVDLTPPVITISSVVGDTLALSGTNNTISTGNGTYDAAERGTSPTTANTPLPVISGTTDAEVGQTVVVTVNGKNYSTTVQTGGTWSVQIPNADAVALNHGNTLPIIAAVTDQAGLSASDTNNQLVVNIASPDIPTVVNKFSSTLTPTLNGMAQKAVPGTPVTYMALETGDTLTVTVGGATYTGTLTIGAGNNGLPTGLSYNTVTKLWSLDTATAVPSSGTLTLVSGNAYDVDVTVNAAGVTKDDISTNELLINTTPPVIVIDTISGDSLIDASEKNTPLLITGTTNAEVGSTVTITGLDGTPRDTTVIAGTGSQSGTNVFSLTVPAAAVSALADNTYTVSASVTNAYNLNGTDTEPVKVDFVASTTAVTITAINDDVGTITGVVASDGRTDDTQLGVSGTLNAAPVAGEVVRVYDGMSLLGTATVTGTGTGITWTFADPRTLIDAQKVTYIALVFDGANKGAVSNSYCATIDLTPPTVVSDTATAQEKGGANNTTAGIDPGGDVLSNDSAGAGDSLSVKDVKDITSAGSATAVAASGTTNIVGSYGTLTIAANGTYSYAVDQTNATVQALNVSSTGLSEVFTYTAKDVAGLTTSATLTITVNGANDAATFSGDLSKAITESNAAQSASGTLTVADVDSATTVMAQSNVAGTAGLGKFSITSAGAWSYVMDSAQNQLKPSDVITDSLTVTTADGTQKVISVVITGTNDAPVLANSAVLTYTEGQVATAINTLVSVTDVDSTTQASAQVAITGGYVSGEDVLSFVGDSATMGNITGSYSAGVMSLVSAGGTATLAQWQAALQAVKYNNTSSNPSTASRTVSYTVNDGALDSVVLTSTINLVGVNNAPVNTVPTAQTTAEDTARVISGLSIADADAGTGTMTVTLSVLHGTITVAAGTGVTVATNSTAGVQLTGTVADINTLLAMASAVTYTSTLNYNGSDTLTMLTSDGGNTGGTALTDSDLVAITVTAVNDAPVNTVPTAQTTAEDTAKVISGLNIADADAGTGTMTVTLSVAHGTITVAAGTGVTVATNSTASVQLTGTVADINTLLASVSAVTYTPTLNYNGSDTLTLLTSDGGNTGGTALTDSDSVAITVTAVNDAPVNTVPTPQTTAEDTAKVISGLSIADADAGTGTMTVTLSVAHGTITVAAGTGVTVVTNSTASVQLTGTVADINTLLASVSAVTYIPTLNYNGSDTLTMLTSDGGNTGGTALTDSDSVAITVNGANDNATIIGTLSGAITEDATPNTASGTLTVADVDAGEAVFQTPASLVGTYGTYTFNSTTGVWGYTLDNTKTSVQALAAGQQVTDTLEVKSQDGTATRNLEVTVTGTNDAPVLTTATAVTMTAVNEDAPLPTGAVGTLVSDLIGAISDADFSPSKGLAITAVNANGTLYYSTDAGTIWTASGALSDSNALLLSGSNRVYFKPNANWSGTIDNAFLYRAWDTTNSATAGSNANIIATGGSTAFSVDSSKVAITVNNVNNAPTLANTSELISSEERQHTYISPNITVADVDNTTLASATVKITDGYVSDEDELSYVGYAYSVDIGNIKSSYINGVLTLRSEGATANLDHWKTALKAVVYINKSPSPNTADRTVSFTINDGMLDSVVRTSTIRVVSVNNAPVNTLPSKQTTDEDTAKDITGLSIADTDAGTGTMTVTLSVTQGTINVAAGTGVTLTDNGSASVQLSGTLSAINALLVSANAVTYTPTLNYNGSDTLTMLTSDNGNTGGTALTDTDTVNIDVTSVNDAPIVANAIPDTTGSGGIAFSYVVPGDSFTDVDNASLNYACSVVDASGQELSLPSWLSFDVNTRKFTGTPPDNAGTLHVKVTASDGNLSVSNTFDIVVNIVNRAPVASLTSINNNSTLGATATPPKVSIVDDQSANIVNNGATITYTLNFSEAIADNSLTASDISIVGGGSAGVLAKVTSTQYTFTVTAPVAGFGSTGITLLEGSYTSALGVLGKGGSATQGYGVVTALGGPEINGATGISQAPAGWTNYYGDLTNPGGLPGLQIIELNGTSLNGGQVEEFLSSGNNVLLTEYMSTSLKDLVKGHTYAYGVEWQQIRMQQGFAGGQLRMTIDGVSTVYTSTGESDTWQKAIRTFVAKGTTANVTIGINDNIGVSGLYQGYYAGAIVVDSLSASQIESTLRSTVGTSATDTLVGTDGGEIFNIATGATSTLTGTDKVYAGAGHDTVIFNNFNAGVMTLDGGSGVNFLQLDSAATATTLDLTDAAVLARVHSFSSIDMTGAGNNTLKLNYAAVTALSAATDVTSTVGVDESKMLVVSGNAGDVLNLVNPSSWNVGVEQTAASLNTTYGSVYQFLSGHAYKAYTLNGATVFVDTLITVTTQTASTTPTLAYSQAVSIDSLFASSFTDSNMAGTAFARFQGVVITAAGTAAEAGSTSSHLGSYQLSSDGGVSWINVSGGLADSTAVYADKTALIRFVGASGVEVLHPQDLTVRLVDASAGVATTTGATVDVSGALHGGSTPYSVNTVTVRGGVGAAPLNLTTVVPVVMDLNRDGFISYGQVTMDVNGDGHLDVTKWTGAQDGVLVWDKFGDGWVHDNSQYAFGQYATTHSTDAWGHKRFATDLEGLADAFDSNRDGKFNAADTLFGQFKVWQDLNQNGVSDTGEVRSLADWGITEFKLQSDGIQRTPVEGVTEAGQTTATTTEGSSLLVSDAGFAFSALDYAVSGTQLNLLGAPMSIDLSSIVSMHHNINAIDLSGTGANTLKLNLADVLGTAAINGLHQLTLTGDANDVVHLNAQEWTDTGVFVTEGTHTYAVYNASMGMLAQLLIDQAMLKSDHVIY